MVSGTRFFCKILMRDGEPALRFAVDAENETAAIAAANVIDRIYPHCIGYEIHHGERLIYSMWRAFPVDSKVA